MARKNEESTNQAVNPTCGSGDYLQPQTRPSSTLDVQPEDALVGQMFAFMLIGGLGSGCGYVAIAFILETLFSNIDGMVTLSHGQQAGLFSLPICIALGIGTGLGMFFARMRQLALSAGILLGTGLLTIRLTWWLWSDQRRTYGYDRSEIVLYYPPLVLFLIVGLIAMVLLAVQAWRAIECRRG